jgi:PAS domain S-box-containing protein
VINVNLGMQLPTVEPMNILMVDDEPANLLALEAVLEGLGANLIRASSGEEALRRVLEMDFVLILLDVQMPNMSGLETAQLLRGMARFEHIPLLFLTAHANTLGWLEQAYALGAVDYLTKPFLPAMLRSKVTAFLELHRLRQQERKRAQEALRQQHELWQTTLASISDAVISTDTNRRITFLNTEAERLTGWSRAEAMGQNLDAVFPLLDESTGERAECPVQTVLETSHVVDHTHHILLISRDGRQCPIEDSASPIRDDAGHLYGVVLVFRDITERKQAEQALQRANDELESRVKQRTAELSRQQTFLAAVLDNVADGVIACNAGGGVTVFNRAARELYGLPLTGPPPQGRLQQEPLYLADGQTPMPSEDSPMARALRGERVRDVEVILAPQDLQRRVLLASGQSFADENGELLGAVISMRDMTEQRRAEEDRQRTIRRLEESNRELEQFATVASHDLQEPLRKIQAFSDRLREDCGEQLDERGRDYMTRILAATGRMRTLIDDLLSYSRVVRKGQPFIEVDLARLAADVVSDLEGRLAQVGGQVEIGPLPKVEADPTQMRQLLQNLLGNALKFRHPERSPLVRVQGEWVPQEMCEITVTDNGIGFEPQYADRIFQMFQRLHGRGHYDGNGIGLAICRRIVERHDGSITATGEPGAGATFQIRLHRHPPPQE